ncbi:MAG: type II secretion system protein [bacterium]
MNNRGFTLVEVAVFIIVMGLVGVTVLTSINTVLKGSVVLHKQTTALQTATQCMEWFVGQRYLKGFDAIPTGDTTPSLCINPNYNVSANVSLAESNYKIISVDVKDKSSNKSLSSLSLLLAAY